MSDSPMNPVSYITRTVGIATVKEMMEFKKEDPNGYAQLREYAIAEMKVLGVPVAE